MTDRELLELAAKAAGIKLTLMEVKNVTQRGDDQFIGYMTNPEQWQKGWFNPLRDDDDAFRLAVTLNIHITSSPTDAWASTLLETAIERKGLDPYSATRRAIVRVAAAIGEEQA